MSSIALLGLALLSAAEPLSNASFEHSRVVPAGWEARTYDGRGEFFYSGQARTGERAVRLTSTKGADIAWQATAAVELFSRYRLSGWIRTSDVRAMGGRGALLNVHSVAGAATPPVTGTQDWTEVSVEFETGPLDRIEINCLLGGWGRAKGSAWYDDVALERLGASPLDVAVRIDAADAGPDISPLIYGQFIEHLGRCIYGGIWAEMLEDRKYFFPVDHAESPWKSMDAANPVETRKGGGYAGDYLPVLRAGQGIVQQGLAARAGVDVVGRIVFAGGPLDVSLVWGDAPEQRAAIACKGGGDWITVPLRFAGLPASDAVRLEIAAKGEVRLGPVSLMPADHIDGMRADTLALLRELDAPIYRWPGGNFVSGYDWHDGIGDPDRRPPRKNPAWLGVEHNDFGIHEFMRFCALVNTAPYVTVNSGLGGVELARDEVEYFNGAPDTPMGRLRAQHGRTEPWAVAWWAVGNEMYGDWQLGHMPLADYVRKHNEFAEAMRAVDPDIKMVGVGASGPWTETMLAQCADTMYALSEHFYLQSRENVWQHVKQMPDIIRERAETHRGYLRSIPALAGKHIPIAMDEWNYWYGDHVFGELGTRYFHKDGLGVAAGLHEFFRNSDVYVMANYAQTVNVIGAIKTSRTAAAFETTGLALAMYRKHFGTRPLRIDANTQPLDVAAALGEGTLTIGVVNPTPAEATLRIETAGIASGDAGKAYRIAGDPMAYNDPGRPDTVVIQEEGIGGGLQTLTAPPYSASIYVWPLRGGNG